MSTTTIKSLTKHLAAVNNLLMVCKEQFNKLEGASSAFYLVSSKEDKELLNVYMLSAKYMIEAMGDTFFALRELDLGFSKVPEKDEDDEDDEEDEEDEDNKKDEEEALRDTEEYFESLYSEAYFVGKATKK